MQMAAQWLLVFNRMKCILLEQHSRMDTIMFLGLLEGGGAISPTMYATSCIPDIECS